MKILTLIFIFTSFLSCTFSSATNTSAPEQPKMNPAFWMKGNWGIRLVIPTGNDSDVNDWNVNQIVNQLVLLKTPKWIMINLTEPSWGGYFSGPHPTLQNHVDPMMVPRRDLFGEMAKALKEKGFHVLVYFAAQGPSSQFISDKRRNTLQTKKPFFLAASEQISDKWHNYLKQNNLTNSQGTASVIISYYSKRYATLIDGWWFDHGSWGDYQLFSAAARKGNPNTSISWNENHNKKHYSHKLYTDGNVWMLTKSYDSVDFTDGHITPTKQNVPWWKGNELVVDQIESTPLIRGAISHYFVPMQNFWRGGKKLFPAEQAQDWTRRIVQAEGAITWAVALQSPEFKKSSLAKTQFSILQKIDASLLTIVDIRD